MNPEVKSYLIEMAIVILFLIIIIPIYIKTRRNDT